MVTCRLIQGTCDFMFSKRDNQSLHFYIDRKYAIQQKKKKKASFKQLILINVKLHMNGLALYYIIDFFKTNNAEMYP